MKCAMLAAAENSPNKDVAKSAKPRPANLSHAVSDGRPQKGIRYQTMVISGHICTSSWVWNRGGGGGGVRYYRESDKMWAAQLTSFKVKFAHSSAFIHLNIVKGKYGSGLRKVNG